MRLIFLDDFSIFRSYRDLTLQSEASFMLNIVAKYIV